jgi:hypothetical protein
MKKKFILLFICGALLLGSAEAAINLAVGGQMHPIIRYTPTQDWWLGAIYDLSIRAQNQGNLSAWIQAGNLYNMSGMPLYYKQRLELPEFLRTRIVLKGSLYPGGDDVAFSFGNLILNYAPYIFWGTGTWSNDRKGAVLEGVKLGSFLFDTYLIYDTFDRNTTSPLPAWTNAVYGSRVRSRVRDLNLTAIGYRYVNDFGKGNKVVKQTYDETYSFEVKGYFSRDWYLNAIYAQQLYCYQPNEDPPYLKTSTTFKNYILQRNFGQNAKLEINYLDIPQEFKPSFRDTIPVAEVIDSRIYPQRTTKDYREPNLKGNYLERHLFHDENGNLFGQKLSSIALSTNNLPINFGVEAKQIDVYGEHPDLSITKLSAASVCRKSLVQIQYRFFNQLQQAIDGYTLYTKGNIKQFDLTRSFILSPKLKIKANYDLILDQVNADKKIQSLEAETRVKVGPLFVSLLIGHRNEKDREKTYSGEYFGAQYNAPNGMRMLLLYKTPGLEQVDVFARSGDRLFQVMYDVSF